MAQGDQGIFRYPGPLEDEEEGAEEEEKVQRGGEVSLSGPGSPKGEEQEGEQKGPSQQEGDVERPGDDIGDLQQVHRLQGRPGGSREGENPRLHLSGGGEPEGQLHRGARGEGDPPGPFDGGALQRGDLQQELSPAGLGGEGETEGGPVESRRKGGVPTEGDEEAPGGDVGVLEALPLPLGVEKPLEPAWLGESTKVLLVVEEERGQEEEKGEQGKEGLDPLVPHRGPRRVHPWEELLRPPRGRAARTFRATSSLFPSR